MDRRIKDLTGKIVGHLVILEYAGLHQFSHQRQSLWLCRCILCGKEKVVLSSSLKSASRNGINRTCGCRGIEHGKETHLYHQYHDEFQSWSHMWDRCTNSSNQAFKHYGARGITIWEPWKKFSIFLADVGLRPSQSHSLDRYPDRNGNYQPNNVRWATQAQQMRNTKRTRFLTYQGVTKCLTDWANDIGISLHVIRYRISQDWPIEDILSEKSWKGQHYRR